MIRIGFDPMLEAEQQHRELIKEVEQFSMVDEGMDETQIKVRVGYKFIALIGRRMASLGARLEEHYGGKAQSEVVVTSTVSPDGCG
jgi:hypothetical protein